MIKKSILGMLLLATPFLASAQFDGAVGTEGCKAISNEDNRIQAWAVGCEVNRGWQDIATKQAKASFGEIKYAIGKASTSTTDAISLGDGGSALLTFDRPIVNGVGPDFAVFENSFNDTFLELAVVEVSSDGVHFVRFPAISNTNPDEQVGGFGSVDPTNLYNLAGKYRIGWGTPFDLEELKDAENLDVNNVRFVRLIDVVGTVDNPELATFDSENHPINDPYPTDFNSSGFDLTGVAVINGGRPYVMSDFAAFNFTTADTAVVPGPTSGEPDDDDIILTVVENSNFYFESAYDDDSHYFSDGFVPTNRTNDTVQAYDYAAITAGGLNGRGTNYITSYFSEYAGWMSGNHNNMYFVDGEAHQFNGLYVTNSTCAYMSMTNGDGYAKKFEQGDWFKLTATALDEESNEHVAEFYLADFRSENAEDHYIVKDWRFWDLSVLGKVVYITFSMSSSDNSYGMMNTPSYYCFDGISLINDNTDSITVAVAVNDEEMGSVSGAGKYAYGSQVVAKAVANEGYKFVKWSNDNTDTVYAFNATENINLTATFAAAYNVVLAVNDEEMGSVEGAGEYAEGENVTIKAIANEGYVFVKWSDENTDTVRSLTITEDVNLIATFRALETFTVTLDVNDEEMGSVEGAGEYTEGKEVTIRAIANEGFRFVKWSDENTDAERTLTITEDVELTAIFEADENPDAIAENEFSNAQILSGEKRIVITNAANATVAVFDAAGRNVVKKQRITSNRETIALPQSGIYIVRMNNNTTAKLFVR